MRVTTTIGTTKNTTRRRLFLTNFSMQIYWDLTFYKIKIV